MYIYIYISLSLHVLSSGLFSSRLGSSLQCNNECVKCFFQFDAGWNPETGCKARWGASTGARGGCGNSSSPWGRLRGSGCSFKRSHVVNHGKPKNQASPEWPSLWISSWYV